MRLTVEETLQRALEKTGELLSSPLSEDLADEIHRTKSLLYAAIERTGLRAERLLNLQRLLRELFPPQSLADPPRILAEILVTGTGDLRDYERRLALSLLGDLEERYAPELGSEEWKLTWAPEPAILINKMNKNRR